jgi:hypothetical protein
LPAAWTFYDFAPANLNDSGCSYFQVVMNIGVLLIDLARCRCRCRAVYSAHPSFRRMMQFALTSGKSWRLTVL